MAGGNVMKKILIILMFALCVARGQAQEQNQELDKLTNLVLSLKGGGEKAFNNAVNQLAKDSLWTPLNDFQDKTSQWIPSPDVQRFQLNKVLGAAQNKGRYEASNKTMLNGEDPRYQYSLYERGVQPRKVFSCNLNKREGKQTFILIPYDGEASTLTMVVDNASFQQKKLSNGVVTCTGMVPKGETIKVSVTNSGDRGQFFVLINYNSRR